MPDDLNNPGAVPTDFADLRDALVARLEALRRAIRTHVAAEGAARLAATLVALAALTLLLDWQLELSLPARICTALVATAVMAYVAYRWMFRPLSIPLAPIEVAAALDDAGSSGAPLRIAPRVASVLQLPTYLSQPADASPALIERAVRRSYEALQPVDFRSGLNRRHLAWCLVGLAMALAVPAAFGMAYPGVARLWAERWFAGSDRPWPRDTQLEVVGVENGKLIVPRGEPVSLQVRVTDAAAPTETVWLRLRTESGSDDTLTLTRFAPGDFRYELPPVQVPLDALVWGGDGRTAPFQIVPVDRPKIAALEIRSQSARDPQPVVHTFTGSEGSVRLLPRTTAALTVETNVPVARIEVDTAGGAPLDFQPIDATHFRAEWTHNEPVQARLTLHGRDITFASHPRGVSIGLLPDRPPRISIRHSGVRLRVTPSATIPLALTARDDFGIKKIDLAVRIAEGIDSKEQGDNAPKPGSEPETKKDDAATEPASAPATPTPTDASTAAATTESGEKKSDQPPPEVLTPESRTVYEQPETGVAASVDHNFELELAPRNLSPGRTVVISASATDDCFTGEQTATSRQLVIRVVRPEELFREILARQQQLRARLRKATDQAETLRDRLPTATIPDEAPELLRTHQLIRREVGNVHRELRETVVEMRLNKLGGEEIWRLIEETILSPMQRLYDQELEQQRQALESQTGPQPDPFDPIIERQETIVKALTSILDNMAQWDSFIDVVNQLNSVIQLEKSVREKTDELRRTQTESIFDQ